MLETTAATPARPRPEDDGHAEHLDFDWRPEPLLRAVDSDRTFRWPIVISAVFIGVSVALVIRLFIAVPADSAAARLAEYRTVATGLDAALLDVVEAPPGDPEAAATLALAVDEVGAAMAQPLPGGVPIVGQGQATQLSAAHERLGAIVDSATTLLGRLRISSDYRQAGAVILSLPLLPTEVAPDLVDSAARTLSAYQADAVSAAGRLGAEPELAAFREYVDEHVGQLATWSELYLLALRRGETDNVESLLAEARARVGVAQAELDARLSEIEDDTTTSALALSKALRDAGLVIPG